MADEPLRHPTSPAAWKDVPQPILKCYNVQTEHAEIK